MSLSFFSFFCQGLAPAKPREREREREAAVSVQHCYSPPSCAPDTHDLCGTSDPSTRQPKTAHLPGHFWLPPPDLFLPSSLLTAPQLGSRSLPQGRLLCSTSAEPAQGLFPRISLSVCFQWGHERCLCLRFEATGQAQKIGVGPPSSSHYQGTATPTTASPLSGSSFVSSSALGISDLGDNRHLLLLQDIEVGHPQNGPRFQPIPIQLVLALPHFTSIFPSPLPALWALKPQHQMQSQQAYREGLTSFHIAEGKIPATSLMAYFYAEQLSGGSATLIESLLMI